MMRLSWGPEWVVVFTGLMVCAPGSAWADEPSGGGAGLAGLAPASTEALADMRGRFTVSDNESTAMTSVRLGDVAAGGSVQINAGPMNTISSDSFGNLQGIATVVQNAASNVLINTTTEMTVNFLP